MSTAPITFWKPVMLIRAEASGLSVSIKATAPAASSKPQDPQRPAAPRQYVSRR